MILLVLFMFVMADRDPSTFGIVELVFIVYTMGWVLDQFVAREPPWRFLKVVLIVVLEYPSEKLS